MPMRSTVRWTCGHCGKPKSTDTGLCIRCHKLPTVHAPSLSSWEFKYDNPNDYHFILNAIGYCFEAGISPATYYSKHLKPLELSSMEIELHWMMLGKITHMTHLEGSE